MTLYETEKRFDTLSLPYVRDQHMEAAAILWYIATYGEFAARELFHDISPDLAGCIARLFVTDSDNGELFQSFANSLGMTTRQMEELFDPAAYKEIEHSPTCLPDKEVTPA